MGSKQSVEKPIESQSIITHSQQHYNTNTNEQSEQHSLVAEARILSNNLSRHIDPEDDEVYNVANYQGAASSQDPNKKSLKISFDRRDTSAPLALTLDNISMLFVQHQSLVVHHYPLVISAKPPSRFTFFVVCWNILCSEGISATVSMVV